MKHLIADLLPHAPQLGLFVVPHIPADRLRNALGDYAGSVAAEDVLALYDATLLGNGKDGAVFTADRLVFQNNNLEPTHTVYYRDIVRVEAKRKLLGGQKVHLDVNRGRATFNLTIDFSGKAEAADYVARFLNEAMLHGAAAEMDAPKNAARTTTDVDAVRRTLSALQDQGLLAPDDFRRLMALLEGRA